MKEQLKKADLFGLVLVASALIARFITKSWTNYQTIVALAGAALIIVSMILRSGEIRSGLGRRSTKLGINSGVSVLLFIGILAFVNYLGQQHQKRFDMTTEHLNSLGDESVKVAGEINEDVSVKAFYLNGDDPSTHELLDRYAHENGKISVQFIDPDKERQAAEKYQITVYGQSQNPLTGQQRSFGTIVLEMGEGKVERIEKRDAVTEEDVTNALMKLVKGETKTLYFVQGHGEKAIDSGERTGYQVARTDLEKSSYVVKTLNLVSEPKVPDDASVVVIAGPMTEPFPQEMDKVDAYLNAGGSVLLMLDPPPAASLKDFTQKWSLDVGNNRIIDITGMGQLFRQGPDSPLVSSYGTHKIVERFNLFTFFPLARSVRPANPPVSGLTAEPLIESNERSWGESDLTSEKVGFDEKVDILGPVPIATVVTKVIDDNKRARLVAFGDSDFAENVNFSQQGNGNLFANTIKWLAGDENFISIKTKSPTDRPLNLTESSGRMISIFALILFPGAALLSGILVWVRRRK